MDLKYLLKDFKRPQGVAFEEEEKSQNYGKFVAQPFERGYAITIGNAFRRTLLSSIPGAAIVAAKINDVLHEFSTIPGVLEDTSELFVNLKRIRFKLEGTVEKKMIHIEKKGAGQLKASDLNVDPEVAIVNPDQYLATLNKDAKIVMDLQIERGRGYVPAEEFKSRIDQIGVVPFDAIFSPVRKVNYKVENTRVGHRTDYEKLILEIWTDGTIDPSDALTKAALILKEHIGLFLNFLKAEDLSLEDLDKEEEKMQQKILEKVLTTSVDQLELTVRSSNCLRNTKIKSIEELVKKSEDEMLKMKNFGRKSLDEIKAKLTEYGLWLGMSDEDLKNAKIKKEIFLNENT
ncbi:MAG: DNA-directed RNA polymerase subunit alpha [Spirochaetes bacterium]|nr:DNA-directed RNA polymerase subunit alpha [Spirochaetota bacterium]